MPVAPDPSSTIDHTPAIKRGVAMRYILWLMIGVGAGLTGAALWAIHGPRIFVDLVDNALAWCM